MEKKIYLFFGQQCKCAKIFSTTKEVDQNIILQKVEDFCERDKNLKMLRQNKIIVLQVKDEDDNIWCDVEDDDKFTDKAKINVIFIPSMDSSPALYINSENVITMTPTVLQNNEMHENMEVLYTEPVDEKNELSDEQDQQLPEEKYDILVQKDNENIISGNTHSEPSCSGLSSKSPSFLNVTDQCFQTLPSLTYDLEEKIGKNGILRTQKDLIYHWGSYLWEKTKGSPKKQDYQKLSSTIVKVYPALGSSEGDSVIVRKSLSTWIRNHRTTLKRQAEKRDHKGRVINSTSNVILAKNEEDQYAVEQALIELGKKRKEGNTPHIRRILKITLSMRRTWIEKSAKSIIEVIEKYPQLANNELVIFEFCNLKNLTEEFSSKKIDLMFDKLTKFFNIEESDEKIKASCLQLLYERVTTIKKNIQPLIIIEEVCSSLKNLAAVEGESPRSVIYTSEDDIATAYIVADTEVNMKIEKPSVKKIIMSLLAAYYVWDVVYPKPYRNILEYLDHEVIGTSIDRKNVVLLKFIRQRDSKENMV